jgi:topoisomerase IA-like protein
MPTSINRTQQLVEAHTRSRFGQKAALQAAGVELPQHNVNVKAKKAQKKAAKKTSSKKSTAKKAAAKKTTKKS